MNMTRLAMLMALLVWGCSGGATGEGGGAPDAARPIQDATAPAGDVAPSPGGEVAPPGGEVAPPGGEVAPPGGEVAPPGGEVAPPGGEVAPPGGEAPPPVVLARIRVVPDALELVSGQTGILSAVATYSDGAERDVSDTARWRSVDSNVAAPGRNLPGQGREVVALGAGTTTFTATLSGVESAPASVSVLDTQVIEIQLDPPMATLGAGSARAFTALALLNDGTSVDVTGVASWRSSNVLVAEVAQDGPNRGLVTGSAAGFASITALYGDVVSTPSRVEVTNAQLSSLELTVDPARAAAGTSARVHATGIYTDGARRALDDQVAFASSDEAVAAFSPPPDAPGTLRALSPGTTRLTARFGDIASPAVDFVVTAAALTRVELEGGAATIPVGQTTRYLARGFFSDGTSRDVSADAAWTTSEPAVASTRQGPDGGLVLGVGPGRARIGASLNGQSAAADLEVTALRLVALTVAPSPVQCAVGASTQVRATGRFSDGSTLDVTEQALWQSVNPLVASVSNVANRRGEVTGLGAGQTRVSATLEGLADVADVTVTAAAIDRIELAPLAVELPLGEATDLTAVAFYRDGTQRDVTLQAFWASSDPAVASVSNIFGTQGFVTARDVGIAYVTATLDGTESEPTEVRVTAPVLRALSIQQAAPRVFVAQTTQLTAIGTYSDDTTEDVTAPALWTSADERVLTVSNRAESKGLVTGLAVGAADVRASFQGLLSPPVAVSVLPVPNSAPTVRLSCPESGRVGEALDFSGAGSTDADGQIAAYIFDMGDGRAPIDTGLNTDLSYTYLLAGQYTVTLSVEDDEGDRGSARCVVAVQSADAPRVRFVTPVGVRQTTHGETLNMLVDARPGIGRRISRVAFFVDGNEVAADDTAPYEGSWQVPMNQANNASLRLQARATDNTNEVGVSDNVTLNVVNTPPVATFLAIPVGVNRLDVDANGVTDDTTPVNGLEVRWDWQNDGVFDTDWAVAKRTSFNYPAAGNYTVRMQVRDNIGQITSATRAVSFVDQRLVNGDIGNDVWFGQVIVTGDIRVLPGTTLTIAAGTQILFVQTDQDNNQVGDYGLLVNGRVLVQGEAENPVVFTSYTVDSNDQRVNGDWDGIILQGDQPSSIANAVVEYSNIGLSVRDASTVTSTTIQQCKSHGVSVTGNGARFTDVTVQGCQDGVNLSAGTNAAFTRLTSQRNRAAGVSSTSHTGLQVIDSALRENAGRGVYGQSATGTMTGTTIAQNTFHGVELLDSTFTLSGLTVTRNGETGVTLRGNSAGSLRQSNVTENRREGVSVQTSNARNPTTVINRNNVFGNSTTAGYRYAVVELGLAVTDVTSANGAVTSGAFAVGANDALLEATVAVVVDAGGSGSGALLNGATNAAIASGIVNGTRTYTMPAGVTSLKVQANRDCCGNVTTTLNSVLVRYAPQAGVELSVGLSAGTLNARENYFGDYPNVLGPVVFGQPSNVDVQGFVGVPFDGSWSTGPYYAGTLPAATRWSGNVYVSGDVTVPAGGTLTIDPGTHVWFSPMDQNADGLGDYVLTATGMVDANGTLADPVLFAPDDPTPTPGDYEGLVLNGAGSTLDYTHVRYGDFGYRVAANATIQDGRVLNSRQDGLRVTAGRATLRRMLVASNGGDGVNVTGAVTIEDSYLNENGDAGLYTESSTASSVSFCEINGNFASGLEVAGAGNLTATSSLVTFNGGAGAFVYSLGAQNPTFSISQSNLFGNANSDGRPNATISGLAGGFPVSVADVTSANGGNSSAAAAMPAGTEAWQVEYSVAIDAGGSGGGEVRNGANGASLNAVNGNVSGWLNLPTATRVTSLIAYANRDCCGNVTTSLRQVRTRQAGIRQVELSVAEYSARVRPILAQNNYWGQFPVVLGDRIREGRAGSVNFDGFALQALDAVGPR